LKGILLAGGLGTRLYPLTSLFSKQLQPIYDKPMIYYPLTTLLLAGVREVLVITAAIEAPSFKRLLRDGSQWGISITYAEQAAPRGIAEALIIGAEFIDGRSSMLMLGDNFVYGRLDFLRTATRAHQADQATVFAYPVSNPSDYGVVEFDAAGAAISLEEKPSKPRSNWAVPGMYIYGPDAPERASKLGASARGELEITDLNRQYLSEGKLRVAQMGRGIAWLDTGSAENLLHASNFVHAVQSRQGLIIGSPEEAAWRMGYMDDAHFLRCIEAQPECSYRAHLERALAESAERL
jgi:glucose-1-phosphate thymidylyltransferase